MSKEFWIALCGVLLISVVGVGAYLIGTDTQKQPIVFMPIIQMVEKQSAIEQPTIVTTTEIERYWSYITPEAVDLSEFEVINMVVGINEVSNIVLTALLEDMRQAGVSKVLIVISTPGGSSFDELAMYDSIIRYRGMGMTIHTLANGYCFSAGVIILQAGEKRYLSQHGSLLVHNAYGKFNTKPTTEEVSDCKDVLKKIINPASYSILKETTKNNPELMKLLQTPGDHWIIPEDALRLGLIDGVI